MISTKYWDTILGLVCTYGRFTYYQNTDDVDFELANNNYKNDNFVALIVDKYSGKLKKQIDSKLWDELCVKWQNGEITAFEFMKWVGLRKWNFMGG